MRFWPKRAKIGAIWARNMILVSKSIYSNRGIQWCIHKYAKITELHIHTNMCYYVIACI